MHNQVLMTDSYKSSHFLQYPPGADGMYSYLESRGGEYQYTVFFGLQYLLKEYLSKPVTMADIDEAREFFSLHGEPFPYEGWCHIWQAHGGFIPVRIRAVPEGTVVPTGNVLLDVESTDPDVFWAVTWIETMLMRLWYPITVATQSHFIRGTIKYYLDLSSDDPDSQINFKLHDFGARGVSSHESAMIGGASHLVNFMGSDTVEGVVMANRYYNHDMAAFSIPSAEHSTITAWGRDREEEAYRHVIETFSKPGALYGCVSDSYDLWHVVDNIWGGSLKEKIIEKGGTLVVRPDSGNPPTIVLQTLLKLDQHFGSTLNSKGYKVLNNVRVIQGDGIDRRSIHTILAVITQNGFSADNVAFGMGGALLQQVNRDTQRFAYKCSAFSVNGEWYGVSKDPVTDHSKASKKGKLDLIKGVGVDSNGLQRYETTDQTLGFLHAGGPDHWLGSVLELVYEDGKILREQSLDSIRKIAQEVPVVAAV